MSQEFGQPGAAFGPGPWENEPGRVEWRHNGMPCLLRRNGMGVWCGYAAVPPGHPLHGADYEDPNVEVHGGLTYAAPCDGEEGVSICHAPESGEPGDVWWFGFDCAHFNDVIPGMPEVLTYPGGEYRTVDFARRETERLAEQLQAVSS